MANRDIPALVNSIPNIDRARDKDKFNDALFGEFIDSKLQLGDFVDMKKNQLGAGFAYIMQQIAEISVANCEVDEAIANMKSKFN